MATVDLKFKVALIGVVALAGLLVFLVLTGGGN
jgi:hypothetical protein